MGSFPCNRTVARLKPTAPAARFLWQLWYTLTGTYSWRFWQGRRCGWDLRMRLVYLRIWMREYQEVKGEC